MTRTQLPAVILLVIATIVPATVVPAQRSFVGFDKNAYPGDSLLPALHRTFEYTGYYLNNPPGMSSNPWAGKRSVVRAAGFGFLILFNGRLDAQLKREDAAALGRADGAAAVASANREGFPSGAVIFLDQEEGGSLLPEQAAYMGAWVSTVNHDAVNHARYQAGVYCSGIPVPSGAQTLSTAQDVAHRFPDAMLWVANDQCPPAPGCVLPRKPLEPAKSGFPHALAWQYAQSPRRAQFTAACSQTYAADNGCYAPALPHSSQTWVDLNVSRSPDPSHGR
jgi:hypothetical protein